MVNYHLYKYKHVYVYTLPTYGRTFKELVVVAVSGEKFTAGRWEGNSIYIPCCPFYIVYHVRVLLIHIFFIKREVELFLLRWKKYKRYIVRYKEQVAE